MHLFIHVHFCSNPNSENPEFSVPTVLSSFTRVLANQSGFRIVLSTPIELTRIRLKVKPLSLTRQGHNLDYTDQGQVITSITG